MANTTIVNFPSRIEVSHEWKTGIQTSMTGKEKRSALFSRPRTSSRNSYNVFGDTERIYFRNALFSYGSKDKIWAVPIFSDGIKLSSAATAGATTISLAKNPLKAKLFQENRYAVICIPSNYSSYEVVTITGVTDSELTVQAALTGNWTDLTNTLVCPLLDCYIESREGSLDRPEQEISRLELSFREVLRGTIPWSWEATFTGLTIATVGGVDIFPSTIELQKNHRHDFKDNAMFLEELGVSAATSYFDETEQEIEYRFFFDNQEDWWELLNFFDKQKGKYDRFFMPSGDKDFRLSSGFTSGATGLDLTPSDSYYGTYFTGASLTGRYIMVYTPSGNSYHRKVTAAGIGGHITIDSAINETVTAYEGADISISYLSRFALDELRASVRPPFVFRGTFRIKVLIGESSPT